MTETLFGYVSSYGLPVIAISAFLSCLALPIPTFAVMLSGGAFAASGDLVLWQVLSTAYLAAVLGDQSGFQVGRWSGRAAIEFLARSPKKEALIARANASVARWGGAGVFLSTWLFAPLGPWVNLIAGAAGMPRLQFLAWDSTGEAIWVATYVGLGFLFGSRLPDLVELVGNWAGLISSIGISSVLGALLVRAAIRHRRRE
ncbi:DedA family protein [Roseitranquillus sediminis]|uniref:DedA family protein n=1 Tax=Roseitranquillus sediminis TaxID=2809051 RepID=UPI001D0C1848|nr:DedA family protein [Roseitranquillus sediminis]MBM9594579.1 DedA family protein [Roseitranquillus sediminis]